MLDNPKIGFDFTAEYLPSAIPWVTSSNITGVAEIEWQYVTKTLIVKNTTGGANTMKVAFTSNGFNTNNYFTVANGQQYSQDLRLRKLYISGSSTNFEIIAGMTMIPTSTYPKLTGSNGWTGIG